MIIPFQNCSRDITIILLQKKHRSKSLMEMHEKKLKKQKVLNKLHVVENHALLIKGFRFHSSLKCV